MKTIEFWNKSKEYYGLIDNNPPLDKNPALLDITKLVKPNMKVLDVGCGEGAVIIDLGRRVKIKGFGIDVSKIGINIAKKKGTNCTFRVVNSEKIPYKDNFFDVALSTYVFEHLDHPEKVLKEMQRVVKPEGLVIIICPNYGSPIYPSPITPKFKHLVRGIGRDIKYIFRKPKKLDWYKEYPKLNEKVFKADYDTTVLPYVYSLHVTQRPYLKASSVWWSETGNNILLKIIRYPFKLLGLMKIYPFRWWGPICYFVWKKENKKKRK